MSNPNKPEMPLNALAGIGSAAIELRSTLTFLNSGDKAAFVAHLAISTAAPAWGAITGKPDFIFANDTTTLTADTAIDRAGFNLSFGNSGSTVPITIGGGLTISSGALNAVAIAVLSTITATGNITTSGNFSGSGSGLTGIPITAISSGILPPTLGGTGINNVGSTLTLGASTTLNGGGTIALGGFTLTVPATGTAALLGIAANFPTVSGGSGASASLVLQSTSGTGTSDSILLKTGSQAATRWTVNTLGHFLAGADGSYDIGASGASRPRNLYVQNGITCFTFSLGQGQPFDFGGQGTVRTIGDGVWMFANNGYNAKAALSFSTNNTVKIRTNDNSADAALTCSNFTASGTLSVTGDAAFGKTITATGTTGAQTINKTSGAVNFAGFAPSLVVTNSLVTANSVIQCTVASNDSTMNAAKAVAAAGSFTIYPNAAPSAETRVNFLVTN